jgi:hypothetical protein
MHYNMHVFIWPESMSLHDLSIDNSSLSQLNSIFSNIPIPVLRSHHDFNNNGQENNFSSHMPFSLSKSDYPSSNGISHNFPRSRDILDSRNSHNSIISSHDVINSKQSSHKLPSFPSSTSKQCIIYSPNDMADRQINHDFNSKGITSNTSHNYSSQFHHCFVSSNYPSPKSNIMGAVDTGCTSLVLPISIAKSLKLDIRPLLDPFEMHFAEKGTFAIITHGVSRSHDYIWSFIAVSDKISVILIDIKQPIRCGLIFIADASKASLLISQPPFTTLITGPVIDNGIYNWNIEEVVNLRRPIIPTTTNNNKSFDSPDVLSYRWKKCLISDDLHYACDSDSCSDNYFNRSNSAIHSTPAILNGSQTPSQLRNALSNSDNLNSCQNNTSLNNNSQYSSYDHQSDMYPLWSNKRNRDGLLKCYVDKLHHQPIISIDRLERGAKRYKYSRKDISGLGYLCLSDLEQQLLANRNHLAYKNSFVCSSNPVLPPTISAILPSQTSKNNSDYFTTPVDKPSIAYPSITPTVPSHTPSLAPTTPDYHHDENYMYPLEPRPEFTRQRKAKGYRATLAQIEYMNALHNLSHHSDSTLLDSYSAWHGLPVWLTRPLMEAFLRSHHCLLCEIYRRRKQWTIGSGVPDQIQGHTLAYDPIWFVRATVFGAIGFYFFCCCATGAIRIILVRDKTSATLILAITQVEIWLKRYGHTLVQLRSDAGTTETSEAVTESMSHISVDNTLFSGPENQQSNPAERQIQPFMQQFKILMASTCNFSDREWGLAALVTEYHYGGTMGTKARWLSDGTKTRNQLITNQPYRVPRVPIAFGTIVTAPFVGTMPVQIRPNNEVYRYLMPANYGSQADIVCSLSNRLPFKMYIRKGVRALHLTSQLQLAKNLQNVEIAENADGEYEIIGMSEPPSVYNSEGYPDPMDTSSSNTLIPSASNTISQYRVNSAVPDSLQCYITEDDEHLAMSLRPITRSMTRASDIIIPSDASISPTHDDNSNPISSPSSSPIDTDDFPHYWFDTAPTDNTSATEPDYTSDDEVNHFAAMSLYETAISASTKSPSSDSIDHHIPINYDELVAEINSTRNDAYHLECLSYASAHQAATNNYEHFALRSTGFVAITNPYPARDYPAVIPFFVDPPTWHPSRAPLQFDDTNMVRNASEEIAYLSFGKKVIDDPVLNARWLPVVRKEMQPYLGTCMHVATPEWFTLHPDFTLCEWICVLKEKRDATTGLHLKDKARFAIDGSVEIRAGKHPDPLKLYCNTLGLSGLRYHLAVAAYKSMQISTSDSVQAFQHTPSTRLIPDVVFLPKELTGAEKSQHYYLTTLFQGHPEASKGFFNFVFGRDGFLQKPPCNMSANPSNPCSLYWRGPPTLNPTEQGEVMMGINTDDNLETICHNKASRDHLLLCRQAFADHGITLVVKEMPDQVVGIALGYTNTSITMTSPTQIYDLINIFYPNNAPIPIAWTPMLPSWNVESLNNSPIVHIDLHRSPVGKFIHLGNTRLECAVPISRFCSRTTHHTQADLDAMRHTVAYLHTTRDIGVTFHSRRPGDPIEFLLTSTSDYAHSVYPDGLGQLGCAVFGGHGPRGPSAPFIATSVKDSGISALTTPDGELKALVSVTKTTLDCIVLATDSGNPQPAVPEETDSQTVNIVSQDLSGKAQVFRHRRRDLSFLINCQLDHIIKTSLVPEHLMVADALTKTYGPLKHWRRIAWLLGESPRLAELRAIVLAKYEKRKKSSMDDSDDEDADDIPPPLPSHPSTTSTTALSSYTASIYPTSCTSSITVPFHQSASHPTQFLHYHQHTHRKKGRGSKNQQLHKNKK